MVLTAVIEVGRLADEAEAEQVAAALGGVPA